MNSAQPHVLIVGCGYVGERLAERLRQRYSVTALTRSAESAARLQQRGVRAQALDLDVVSLDASIPERLDQEAIVYLAPPPPSGESDFRLDRFLQLAAVPPRTFVYMSTTGVYGDTQGELVDESTPVRPLTERARRRVSAEEMTRVWCSERRVRRVVLRAPGIYGPGRLMIDRLQQRLPVVCERDAGITNRVHVDDLVEACVMAVTNADARGVYNVTDGNAISSTAFAKLVATLAGLPNPPEVSMEEAQLTFSPQRLSFLGESRRVSNARMLKHLGVSLTYADVTEGIRASLEQERGLPTTTATK